MAIDTIKANAIFDGAVDTADLANNAVTTAKIAAGQVTSAKVDSSIPTIAGTNAFSGSNSFSQRVNVTGGASGRYGPYEDALRVKGNNYSYLEIEGTNSQAGIILNKDGSTGMGIGYSNVGRLKIKPIASIDSTGIGNWKDQNTSGLEVDTSGYIFKPNQPRFFAYNSGRFPSSGNVSGGTVFVFNSTNINVGNHFNTSNYRFTAPVAGTYVFGCHLRAANDGSTRVLRIMLRKNGGQMWDLASIGGSETPALGGADHPGMTGVTIISANASDYFDLEVNSELNFNGNLYFDSGTRTNFWGYLLA